MFPIEIFCSHVWINLITKSSILCHPLTDLYSGYPDTGLTLIVESSHYGRVIPSNRVLHSWNYRHSSRESKGTQDCENNHYHYYHHWETTKNCNSCSVAWRWEVLWIRFNDETSSHSCSMARRRKVLQQLCWQILRGHHQQSQQDYFIREEEVFSNSILSAISFPRSVLCVPGSEWAPLSIAFNLRSLRVW